MAFTPKTYTAGQTVITAQNLNDINTFLGGGIDGLKDYVVEQGSSGSWFYRKWNSGIAECWGIPSKSVTSNTTFLDAHTYSTYFDLPSGLFTSVDMANANPKVGSNYAIPAYINTTPTSVGVDALSNESGTKDFSAHIMVRGRWK